MRDNPLLALILVFVPFSLVSVGGGPSILAGIQHQTVDVRHWLDAREFLDIFAIARAAPGPGSCRRPETPPPRPDSRW
jgi:chromate transporter